MLVTLTIYNLQVSVGINDLRQEMPELHAQSNTGPGIRLVVTYVRLTQMLEKPSQLQAASAIKWSTARIGPIHNLALNWAFSLRRGSPSLLLDGDPALAFFFGAAR